MNGTQLPDVALRLHPDDDVAIARVDLQPGSALVDPPDDLAARQPIPTGHKVALREIAAGQPVRRYGQIIGLSRQTILPGEWVHTHNLGVAGLDRDPAFGADIRPVPHIPKAKRRTFLGYKRPDGRAGTRNYIAVLSTVNCSAHATREIARHFTPERLAAFPNVDGVVAMTHCLGCPLEYLLLERTLAGMARHPNVGGYLLVGLGCETNQAAILIERHGLHGGTRLAIQELGGLRQTVEAGIAAVEAMLPTVNAIQRTPLPISKLTVAVQCGGSDSWSGVTANPVVGLVADEIIRQGGAVVLAETPEIYGAEHLLTRRAASPEIGQKLLDQVRWWEAYARRMGFGLDDNRSAGNEAGGLTTIYEKSLGAVAKAGSTPLCGVYDYAEPVVTRGLAFMNTPGYDPVSVTGQVAGGCNLVLFTTGRGSVFGSKPAPCLKIGSTSVLYQRMLDDIDFDAGRLLAGANLAGLADELLDLAVTVACGQPSKSEAQGVGEAEFCPWDREGML
ncbi:MAG: altronate dehydratase [Anaerolineae bacterium]|nr:altronate dehydratase [Anaerolineae bacterium]